MKRFSVFAEGRCPPAPHVFGSAFDRGGLKTNQKPSENDRKRTENKPKTIENSAENDRKRRRNEAFEFDSNCQAS